MFLIRLMFCGAVAASLLPAEPDLGFGRPQLSSQLLETARDTIRERLNEVKLDLAQHSATAAQLREAMNTLPKV